MGVDSFGVTPGSHIAFFDLAANSFVTVNGQKIQRTRPTVRNPEKFIRAKPKRPEDTLQQKLDEYHEKPHEKVRGQAYGGLPALRGISRDRRYQARGSEMGAKEFYEEVLQDTLTPA